MYKLRIAFCAREQKQHQLPQNTSGGDKTKNNSNKIITGPHRKRKCRKEGQQRNPDTMSASDLAPFVAAVIEDGIVADMQRKIKELESKIHKHESARLLVQVTGQGGNRIYGENSLKKGSPFPANCWSLDDEFVCPFDEETVALLEIRVGGIVLLKQFLIADDRYECSISCFTGGNGPTLSLHITASNRPNRNQIPIDEINAQIRLATSSSTSIDDNTTFLSLIKSFLMRTGLGRTFQLEQLLHHFDTLIDTDDERGVGTKLTMTIETIEFSKNSISGCMSLMDELGIQTTN